MNHGLSFAFIGGDRRQQTVINQLAEDGHRIQTFGLEQASISHRRVLACDSVMACLKDARVIVFPLPYSTDSQWVYSPLSTHQISVKEVCDSMTPTQFLLAGKCDTALRSFAAASHVRVADYMEREEFAIRNAIPTVEGAIAIAMEQTPFTIHGSACLVLGYGRIGKLLAENLKGLGASVSVGVRKVSDFAWLKAHSLRGIYLKNLPQTIGEFQIIFNTIPHKILDFPLLSSTAKDCLIIDLASRPGGVDFETASHLGRQTIHALSLPGKVAPETAGIIIKDTIINILEELGV